MTVTGATTAGLATASYTPPFKSVSSNPPAVQITGSVTSAVSNNPTGSAGTSDSDYAWAYLQAHMMSPPSYRYAYLLWFVLALIAILYAISHHLRLSGGSLGASFASFGMRRHTLGSKKPGRRNRALPSNNIILTLGLITIITALMCLIGADYIVPTSSTLNFADSFRKRAAASSTAPGYTISKSFWTLGSRFGFIAFALMPLVVLLALKSPPVGFLSLRALTQLYADKLAMLHRGVGWLVWAVTTVHVALWSVQLFEDSRNGRATWFFLWTNYRFIFGCVAYFALTAVMVLSLRPIRKNGYEFFYIAHVVLVILTMAACAVHHPVLWYWMAAAGGLWALERIIRFIRFARVNALFGKRRTAPLQAGPSYAYVPTHENAYDMQEFKPPVSDYPAHPTDKTLPRVPPHGGRETTPEPDFGQQRNSGGYYDEGSLQPLGSYESRHGHNSAYPDPYAPSTHGTLFGEEMKLPRDASMGHLNRNSTAAATATTLVAPEVPAGFAQAQLLPSRTIRLTIKLPRPFKWAAGQSCLLYLPELSRIQSHPFTIVNNDNDTEMIVLVKARKGLTRKLYNHVRARSLASVGVHPDKDKRYSNNTVRAAGEEVLQMPPVHVRTWVDGPFGSSKRVRWNEFATVVIICGGSGVSFGAAVCDHVCRLLAHNRDIASRKVKTQRVRFCWVVREYAEIAWVAGQLYRCRQLVTDAQLEISIFVTRAARQQGDDFALPQPGFAKYGRRDSQDSLASDMSRDSAGALDMDLDEPSETSPSGDLSTQYADVIDLTNYDDEEDVNDPADQHLSNKIQHQGKVRRARSRKAARGQGRHSGSKHMSASSSYPPAPAPRKRPSMLGLDDASHQYAAAAAGTSDAYDALMPDPHAHHSGRNPFDRSSYASEQSPFAGGTPSGSRYSLNTAAQDPYAPPPPLLKPNRQSFRSISDSTYGMYDPYAGGTGLRGPSPSPSIMMFDDAQSIAGESTRNMLSRASRTGSMVFLDESGAGGRGLDGDGGDGGLWVDQADYAAMSIMAEVARPGKPKLASVLEEEIARAGGAMIVATCGPVTLNTVVRNLVAKHISPSRIRHGDKRGHIAIYSEDYES